MEGESGAPGVEEAGGQDLGLQVTVKDHENMWQGISVCVVPDVFSECDHFSTCMGMCVCLNVDMSVSRLMTHSLSWELPTDMNQSQAWLCRPEQVGD